MASILEKKIGGKSYFYEVQSYRADGKVKQRILRYFGRQNPKKNPNATPIIKSQVKATYRFGEVAMLLYCAETVKFIETIDKYMPKRQTLSHGLMLFLLAAHRLTGDKPSSNKLKRWSESTFLPLLLKFDPAQINKNTIAYTLNCVYNDERKINHTPHIAKELYDLARKKFGGKEEIYFYDLTSTYFEGTCCPIARFGYNRDGLKDKLQINIGLVIDKTLGLPLMTKVFEGNIHDTKTVYEMVYYAKFVLKKDKIMLIMDRGMDSEDNIRIIDTTGDDFILGVSSKHGFVKELKLKTDAHTKGWGEIVIKEKKILLQRFTKNLFGKRRFVVLYYSEEKAVDKKEIRDRNIAYAEQKLKDGVELTFTKAKKIINGISKYIRLEEKEGKIIWQRDQIKINKAERMDGKFCIMTNKDLDAKDIYKLYFSKDKVEKAFRHMKQDLNLHPTRRILPDRVRADVFICHLAYLLLAIAELSLYEKKINIFWDTLLTETKEIKLLEYRKCSGNSYFDYVSNNELQKNIVGELGLQKYVPVNTTPLK